MDWDRRDGVHDRELMRAGSDALFADPLGIRGADRRGGGSSRRDEEAPAYERFGARARDWEREKERQDLYASPSREPAAEQDKTRKEAEEDGWGLSTIGSMLWYVVAGGKQCCSMRDRTCRPQDSDIANRCCSMRARPQDAPAADMSPEQVPPGSEPLSPLQSSLFPEPPRQRPQERDPPPARQGRDPPSSAGAAAAPSGSRGGRQEQEPPPASGRMPARWEWPSWCLNFREPCIEVFVIDEETGANRWVKAEPQSRVVDKDGRDAYLCAEYKWDNEFYVQDFGPHHVRRVGQKATVFQLFEKAERSGGG